MDSCPSLTVLIQILATLSVRTATNKPSSNAHKYLKTYLRNTTKEERLNGLALLYVHRYCRIYAVTLLKIWNKLLLNFRVKIEG